MNRLAAAVNVADLSWIAREALPLAGDRRQIHDYNDVINLLCHLAHLGGSAVREQIGGALFLPGKQLDRMLIQVAPLFKNEKPSREQITSFADQIAKEIGLQVQFVGSDKQATQVPETIMAYNQPMGEQTRVISFVGGVGLHAVARHRDLLPPEMLDRLIETILAMANEPENSLANRTMLVQGLRQFADCVDKRTRRSICLVLIRIAKGEIVEPSGNPAAETTNPLNPFKFDQGQPDKLQTAALVTLTEIALPQKALTRLVWPVLEEAIYAPNSEVRRGAFAAAARLPEIPATLLLAVLTGCRDPEPEVASAAFFALAKQPSWKLTRSQWRIFLHGLRLAAQSPYEKMRCNAAWAGSVSEGRAPTKGIKTILDAYIALFRQDICASVREATRVSINFKR